MKTDVNSIYKEKYISIKFDNRVNSFVMLALLLGSSAYIRLLPFAQQLFIGLFSLIFIHYFISAINEEKETYPIWGVMVLYFFLGISTYLGNKNKAFFYYMLQACAAVSFVNYEIHTDCKKLLEGMRNISTLIMAVNFFLLIIKPEGFGGSGNSTFYFLGYRIAFTPYVFLACFLAMICDQLMLEEKLVSAKTVYTIVLSFATVLVKEVGTGTVGLIILVCGYYFYILLKRRICNVFFIELVYLAGFLSIVVYKIQERWTILSFILVDILKRDVTFDNRTYIWDSTLDAIVRSPLFGYGVDSVTNVVFPYSIKQLPAHNQFLAMLEDGGVISFSLFVIIIFFVGIKINKIDDWKMRNLFTLCFLGILVIFFTEIQTTKAIVYLNFTILLFGDILTQYKYEIMS